MVREYAVPPRHLFVHLSPHGEAAIGTVVVMQGHPDLLEVVRALCPACCLSGGLHRRKKQCDQNSYDGNHHQQLDEGETDAFVPLAMTQLIPGTLYLSLGTCFGAKPVSV